MDIAIHINPALSHQRQHGEWFAAGFKRHGIAAQVTASVTQRADVHIVSGPWYAKPHWLGHPRVVLLDRCYYKGDPAHVSLGWMNKNGSRTFNAGSGRVAPVAKGSPPGKGSIFLQDYRGPIEAADTIRCHPAADDAEQEPLLSALRRHSVAIGYKTTALVTAALEGLKVTSHDPDHILNQGFHLLPYADWHLKEIQSGEAWEHLWASLLSQT